MSASAFSSKFGERLLVAVCAWSLIVWHIIALVRNTPNPEIISLLPFLSAYLVEYAIKTLDDIHLPSKNFSTIVHILLSGSAGALILIASALILSRWEPIWFVVVYTIITVVINKTNFICTKAESDSLKNKE